MSEIIYPIGWIDPLAVPESISPRQIRMAMTKLGFRSQVESAVSSGDQDLKDWWEFSSFYERNHQMVKLMASALGVSESQLDELWILGATL